MWYHLEVIREQIHAVLENGRSGRQEDQEELAKIAREIEARRNGVYVMNDEERAAVREGLEQARRGEFVSDEEMDTFWAKIDEALSRSAEDVRQGKFATHDQVKAIFGRYRLKRG
jgi:predicted transcriptional regulator